MSYRCFGRVLFSLLLLGTSYLSGSVAAETYQLGGQRELFVDRHRIESLNGVELRLHEPRDGGVALKFDAPWEGSAAAYVTVFKDGDKVKLYYRGWPIVGDDNKAFIESACYAESTDGGLTFTRPKLGLVESNGSKENNILMAPKAHNFAPFKDTRPGVPADEQYKAVMSTIEREKRNPSLDAFTSPDGIHWKRLGDQPILNKEPYRYGFDSQNLAFWDPNRKQYVCYYRVFVGDIRSIAIATSDDFRTWSGPTLIDLGDGAIEQFYTNATTTYFRAPQYYFAFPKRFMKERKLIQDKPGISDGVFLSSRDGVKFDRTFGEAFIRPGRDQFNWGDRGQMVAWGIVQTAPDEMSIYYSQNYHFPNHHLRRGVLRLDGIASAHAGGKQGELVTKPFTFTGKQLTLNYATSAAGSVQVEIQNADGSTIPGFTLSDAPETYGDKIDAAYAWKNGTDVASLAGKPVRLRFVLKDADLYSYRFTE
jgi:hypothetical protein